MCKRVRDALALVDDVAEAFAVLRIGFDRDETDSFKITLTPGILKDPTRLPSKTDVMPLLPRGSQWHDAVGWRSFFALPFHAPSVPDGVVVGAEGVVPHPSRGAFPVFRGLLIRRESVSVVLDKIASHINAGVRERDGLYGVIESTAKTPAEHERVESWLLRLAAASYRNNDSLLLRPPASPGVPVRTAVPPLPGVSDAGNVGLGSARTAPP